MSNTTNRIQCKQIVCIEIKAFIFSDDYYEKHSWYLFNTLEIFLLSALKFVHKNDFVERQGGKNHNYKNVSLE